MDQNGEKKFSHYKNFALRKFLVHDRVQNKGRRQKLDLEKFQSMKKFFLAKSLKMSCLMEKW